MTNPSQKAERFGAYTVHERLGIGGVATVHRAIHEDGQEVALKRLLPQFQYEKSLRDQFVREANIARNLQHPNIVSVREFGFVNEQCFLAMEHVRGQSLLDLLKRSNRRARGAPADAAIWIVEQVLSGLIHAMYGTDENGNAFHVVHRDLSPSNIILTPGGELKLIDFGIAKSIDGRYATSSGRIKGKLGYMAPEIMRGKPVDARSDVFSLSVVLWELLAGQRMFREAVSYEPDNQLAREQSSDSFAIIAAPLEMFLANGLAEDPDDRFDSVLHMQSELHAIANKLGIAPSRESARRWTESLENSPRFLADLPTLVEPPREEPDTAVGWTQEATLVE